jgi:glycerol kinase
VKQLKYILLALGIGTTSVKTSIVNKNLKIVNTISTELDLITTDGGIVEFEPGQSIGKMNISPHKCP